MSLAFEMIAVLLVLGITVFLFVSEIVRVDFAAIIAVMIIGSGLDRTDVMSVVATWIDKAGSSTIRSRSTQGTNQRVPNRQPGGILLSRALPSEV